MKFVKLSYVLFALLFMLAVIPSAEARTNFSFNVSVGPRPCYVAPAPVVYAAPAPVVVNPYPGYAYYPAYPAYSEVVVGRGYYVHPHYSYWRY